MRFCVFVNVTNKMEDRKKDIRLKYFSYLCNVHFVHLYFNCTFLHLQISHKNEMHENPQFTY